MSGTKQEGSGVVVTPVGTLTFSALFTPVAFDDGEAERYSARVVFDGKDPKVVEELKELVRLANLVGDAKLGAYDKRAYRLPVKKNEEGDFVLRAKTMYPLVTNARSQIVDSQLGEIRSSDLIYNGCLVKLGVSFYTYDKSGNRGVGCFLQMVQKVAEGERANPIPEASAVFNKIEPQNPSGKLTDEDVPF